MNKKKRFNYEGKNVQFLKTSFNVYMLDKIQEAIESIKISGEKKTTIELDFSELILIRRFLIQDDIMTELCRDNLLESMDLMKQRRGTKN